MIAKSVDVMIVGAGPVGLMCAYLGELCGLTVAIADKSDKPLEVGRADALNARTLQMLELASLFDELYPLGKICNTSSVWKDGKFISRQSTWWEAIEGCFHKHFLMLGQAHIEKLLDNKLVRSGKAVKRSVDITNIELNSEGCLTTLSTGESIQSKYLIGADGSRSFVRQHFQIPFTIIKPEIIWAVIDGVIETDFVKVPEIIVFQAETSDVAWIPREENIDRFYVRMDVKEFSIDDAIHKINIAIKPHTIIFKNIVWFSQFSVKESVAEKYFVHDRVFLAGDACHIHSVNGGQGLNTGLSDAFNLMWKLNMVLNARAPTSLLQSYGAERRSVAKGVIETSGELVRATKYSANGTHAEDYVEIVKKHAGYITGMGIGYNGASLRGSRIFDLTLHKGKHDFRLYALLDYSKFTVLIFSNLGMKLNLPPFVNIIQIYPYKIHDYWTTDSTYKNLVILVRPDSYIEMAESFDNVDRITDFLKTFTRNEDFSMGSNVESNEVFS